MVNGEKVLNFNEIMTLRKEFSRLVKYRKVADRIARRPFRWLAAYLFMNAVVVYTVVSVWGFICI